MRLIPRASVAAVVALLATPAVAGASNHASVRSVRTQALGFLGGLLPSLPAADQANATQTIGDVVQSSPDQVTSLADALQGGNLSDTSSQLLSQALTEASGFMDAALAQLQNLIPNL